MAIALQIDVTFESVINHDCEANKTNGSRRRKGQARRAAFSASTSTDRSRVGGGVQSTEGNQQTIVAWSLDETRI